MRIEAEELRSWACAAYLRMGVDPRSLMDDLFAPGQHRNLSGIMALIDVAKSDDLCAMTTGELYDKKFDESVTLVHGS